MARGTFHGYVVSLTCGMAAVAALGCKTRRRRRRASAVFTTSW